MIRLFCLLTLLGLVWVRPATAAFHGPHGGVNPHYEEKLWSGDDFTPERTVTVILALRRDGLVQRRKPNPLNSPNSVSRELLVEFLKDPSVGFVHGPRSVPLVIAMHETGFRNLRGDHHLSEDGTPVSCGLTQIRTDFEGRPRCQDLLDNPRKALEWTANHLNRLYVSKPCIERGLCLSRYAGAGPKAREFQNWVLEVATFAETHAETESEERACLPLGLEVR